MQRFLGFPLDMALQQLEHTDKKVNIVPYRAPHKDTILHGERRIVKIEEHQHDITVTVCTI